MTDFEIECSKCENSEEAYLELEVAKDQIEVIEKMNTLVNFKVVNEGASYSLECLNCGHEHVFLEDETSDILDMIVSQQGYSEKVKTVKLFGKQDSYWATILYVIVITLGFLTGIIQSSFDLLGVNFYTLISLLILVSFVPIHELIHFIIAKVLNYNPDLHLFSNRISTPIKRNHFLLIVLSPLIVMTVAYLIFILAGNEYSSALYVAMALNINGAKQDIRQFFAAVKCPKPSYVFGNSKNEIRAYKKTAENII